MERKPVQILAVAMALILMLPAGGCFLAADLVSPALIEQLGLDPGTIFPSRGTIIVTFTNNTDSIASFFAFETQDQGDLTVYTRNFSVQVDPGETRNEVLSCPVGALSPGTVGPDFEVDFVGANVGGTTDVTYGGAPLFVNEEYVCGDVVAISLEQSGAGGDQQAAYQISVQVIPGR